MQLRNVLLAAVILSLHLFTVSVRSTPIFLGAGFVGNLDTSGDLARLNNAIAFRDAVGSDLLPSAVLATGQNKGATTPTGVQIDVTGHQYLMLKWGNTAEFYYVGGDKGILTFTDKNGSSQGLVYYDLFDTSKKPAASGSSLPSITKSVRRVPDQGTTVILLGLSLCVAACVSRRGEATP